LQFDAQKLKVPTGQLLKTLVYGDDD